jgi:excisionase family DNA binding protein
MRSKGWIHAADAAEQCGVHLRTVYRWIESGRARATKVGGVHVYVWAADLDDVPRLDTAAAPPKKRRA